MSRVNIENLGLCDRRQFNSVWLIIASKLIKGITKLCDHPQPSTTSHNFAATTLDQP